MRKLSGYSLVAVGGVCLCASAMGHFAVLNGYVVELVDPAFSGLCGLTAIGAGVFILRRLPKAT